MLTSARSRLRSHEITWPATPRGPCGPKRSTSTRPLPLRVAEHVAAGEDQRLSLPAVDHGAGAPTTRPPASSTRRRAVAARSRCSRSRAAGVRRHVVGGVAAVGDGGQRPCRGGGAGPAPGTHCAMAGRRQPVRLGGGGSVASGASAAVTGSGTPGIGWLSAARQPRRPARCRPAVPAPWRAALQFATGRRAVDPPHFVPLHQQHVAGHAGDAEPLTRSVSRSTSIMPHGPAGRGDLGDQRRHLPAGAAPRGREIEQHDLAGAGRRGGIGRGRRGHATRPQAATIQAGRSSTDTSSVTPRTGAAACRPAGGHPQAAASGRDSGGGLRDDKATFTSTAASLPSRPCPAVSPIPLRVSHDPRGPYNPPAFEPRSTMPASRPPPHPRHLGPALRQRPHPSRAPGRVHPDRHLRPLPEAPRAPVRSISAPTTRTARRS